MSRALITANSRYDRERAAKACLSCPAGTRIEFKAAKRTLPQNDRMWAMLTDIAAAGSVAWAAPDHNGLEVHLSRQPEARDAPRSEPRRHGVRQSRQIVIGPLEGGDRRHDDLDGKVRRRAQRPVPRSRLPLVSRGSSVMTSSSNPQEQRAAEHTPGSWVVEPDHDGMIFVVAGAWPYGSTICEIPDEPREGSRKANADLIALAPTLLKQRDDLVASLTAVRKIIAEGAATGFNCNDGDWAERLYQSQQATSRALRATHTHGET